MQGGCDMVVVIFAFFYSSVDGWGSDFIFLQVNFQIVVFSE